MHQNEEPFEITQVEIDFINCFINQVYNSRLNVNANLGDHMNSSYNGGHAGDTDTSFVNEVSLNQKTEIFCRLALAQIQKMIAENKLYITNIPRNSILVVKYTESGNIEKTELFVQTNVVISTYFEDFLKYLTETNRVSEFIPQNSAQIIEHEGTLKLQRKGEIIHPLNYEVCHNFKQRNRGNITEIHLNPEILPFSAKA